MEKEVRNVNNSDFQHDESRTVSGYACVFERQSKYIGWVETIHRGAITEETINESDVLCLFNHNPDKVLARSNKGKGTLLLEVDDKGLRYMFDAPNTELGNELLEYLKRGDITCSSFCFGVDKTDPTAEKWHKEGDVLYRDIYKIKVLYDCSPVWTPAYLDTSVSKRYSEVKATSDEIEAKMNIIKSEIENL